MLKVNKLGRTQINNEISETFNHKAINMALFSKILNYLSKMCWDINADTRFYYSRRFEKDSGTISLDLEVAKIVNTSL